jgi:hypothetical protein
MLHRTPVHHEALRLIRDGRVVWRPTDPPSSTPTPRRSAGFSYLGGKRLGHGMLVALYELRANRFIAVVDDDAGLTADGRARLSEWDSTKAGTR